MPIDNGNHSRTGKGAETAITPDCTLCYMNAGFSRKVREGANKQVISSQADSLIKISRIWADF
ncbi:hypothetical protein, partial [Klebsiella pneumoniae]|uniref:hypothetical protein n=1 Tax=Klebsiella pneumoniae TaxID=573 RepID=UPI001C63C362